MDLINFLRKNELLSLPLYSITRNKAHKSSYIFFENSSKWDEEELNRWQFDKVKEIIEYAYQHVPFYRRMYMEAGFEPGDMKNWDVFESLPCITKEIVKENEQLFYSDEKNLIRHRVDYTGGSTGQPMRFLVDDDIYWREDAAYRYYWNKTGFKIGRDKCIILRGQKIYNKDSGKVYEYNRYWNYMYLDSRYLNYDNFKLYDAAIKRFSALNIQAYPSSLVLLAKMYSAFGITPPRFDRIYLGSENVNEAQLTEMKETFCCQHIFNQYGHSEKVILALQTLQGDALGIVPTYGYTELLDDQERGIRKCGIVGELTGTGLSKSMPFIRYRTGDRASYSNEKSNDYMENWRKINRIEGRLHEFIKTSDGRMVSICTVGGAHIEELNTVLDMQYAQTTAGELFVNVVENPNKRLSPEDIVSIEKKYEELFDGEIKCKLKTVPEIKRTPRNKKVMIIQNNMN